MSTALLVLEFLVFPGLLFTAVAGLVTTWVDRKVTARVQMRVGPPFLQPFYDLGKLMIKETCVPADGPMALFLLAPLLGDLASRLSGATLEDAQPLVERRRRLVDLDLSRRHIERRRLERRVERR